MVCPVCYSGDVALSTSNDLERIVDVNGLEVIRREWPTEPGYYYRKWKCRRCGFVLSRTRQLRGGRRKDGRIVCGGS